MPTALLVDEEPVSPTRKDFPANPRTVKRASRCIRDETLALWTGSNFDQWTANIHLQCKKFLKLHLTSILTPNAFLQRQKRAGVAFAPFAKGMTA
jgi:hypothetical protein